MAKSIRSRRQRKMRALKREKYAPKELAKLKKVLENQGIVDTDQMEGVTVTNAQKIKEDKDKKTEQEEGMDVDRAKPKYNRKTMRDENGHYPVWMHKRKVKKLKGKKGKKGKGNDKW